MGIFGWSLPPGCNSVPGDEPEPPCSLCGKDVDRCHCPPCKTCGEHGCVEHLSNLELVKRYQTHAFLLSELRRVLDKRETEQAQPCPICKEPVKPCLVTGDPLYCQNCKVGELDERWYEALEAGGS